MKIKHYDLFAGIGGFSYALDNIFHEQKNEHIFCEWEAFPTAVLKKHWPDATYYQDIDEMVKQFTGLSAIEYNNLHGLSTVEEIRQRSQPLSKRDVNSRHRELLRNIETSDVEDTTTQGVRDAEESAPRKRESFLQRHESKRQSSESIRESNQKRSSDSSDSLSNMRGHGGIQRREDKNTSTPSRLQQTVGSGVAMSKMSPRMAQELQADNINYERITTDTKSTRARENEQGLRGLSERHHQREQGKRNITIVTGGFPCQEFSHAGKRKGTSGSRYKWPEMLSLIHKIKPDIVVAENVRGLTTWERGLALETVCTNLEECGYSVQPIIIPACSVGAPHKRERVWIVANLRSEESGGVSSVKREEIPKTREPNQISHSDTRQQLREQGGCQKMESNKEKRSSCSETNQRRSQHLWSSDWREIALATCHDGVDDGLPRKLDGATYRGKRTDCISAAQHRKERLKACGNAIVPQVAMEIFEAIKKSI